MRPRLVQIDERIQHAMYVFGHQTHGFTLGLVFVWFGTLKVAGQKTATSIIAETVYFGSPEVMVPVLGAWEILIGLTLIVHKLHRVALVLLAIRLPGTVLALVLKPDACFVDAPWVPTIAGQYIIKDLMLLSAAAVMGGYVKHKPHRMAAQPPGSGDGPADGAGDRAARGGVTPAE